MSKQDTKFVVSWLSSFLDFVTVCDKRIRFESSQRGRTSRRESKIQCKFRRSSLRTSRDRVKRKRKGKLSPVRRTTRREIVARRICWPGACRVLVDHSTEPAPLPIPSRYIQYMVHTRRVRTARLTYGGLSTRASPLNRDLQRVCYDRG